LLTGAAFDLSNGVCRLILEIESIRFGFDRARSIINPSIPNVVIAFKVSSQTFGQMRPDLRFYESKWETSSENGLPVREVFFKKSDDKK